MLQILQKILLIGVIVVFTTFQGIQAKNNYKLLDEKIKRITQQISQNKNYSHQKRIDVTERIMDRLGLYLITHPNNSDLINHIIQQFKQYIIELEESNTNTIIMPKGEGIVTDYQVTNNEFSLNGVTYFTIRSFTQNNIKKYLVLNGKDFTTSIINASNIEIYEPYGEIYQYSEYKKHQDGLINQSIKSKESHQNYGLHSSTNTSDSNQYITADFCPSSKHGFEKDLFIKLENQSRNNVGIAITQAWIDGHSQDFEWLKQKQAEDKLNITWINHTKTHIYQPGVPFRNNFILSAGLNLEDEILTVEKTLIQHGQTPSIFMRFPGLVSDQNTREAVIRTYGLIPLGSDAWLAKGEIPKDGSIILIHGNKNEPDGIRRMNNHLDTDSHTHYGNIHSVLKYE